MSAAVLVFFFLCLRHCVGVLCVAAAARLFVRSTRVDGFPNIQSQVHACVSCGQAEIADDVEVDESATGKTGLDAYSEYLSQAVSSDDGVDNIVCDPNLGLAIESLPASITTAKLWSLFPEDDDTASY